MAGLLAGAGLIGSFTLIYRMVVSSYDPATYAAKHPDEDSGERHNPIKLDTSFVATLSDCGKYFEVLAKLEGLTFTVPDGIAQYNTLHPTWCTFFISVNKDSRYTIQVIDIAHSRYELDADDGRYYDGTYGLYQEFPRDKPISSYWKANPNR